MTKPFLILCLGNEVIADDTFGPEAARILLESKKLPSPVEVIYSPVAGFALLDLLAGRERVLIVDTIQTGHKTPAGHLSFLALSDFPASHNLTSSHQISLPTALELGKRMGMTMPRQIEILAVEAADLETLGGPMTAAVQAALNDAVSRAILWAKKASRSKNQ